MVCIEALAAVWISLVARPLNSRTGAELGIRQSAVIAGPAPTGLFPGVESLFSRLPIHHSTAVLVSHVHLPGNLHENIEIRPRFPRRINRFVANVHCAVRVSYATRFLTPNCRRKNDVREGCRFCAVSIRNHHKQLFSSQNLPDRSEE